MVLAIIIVLICVMVFKFIEFKKETKHPTPENDYIDEREEMIINHMVDNNCSGCDNINCNCGKYENNHIEEEEEEWEDPLWDDNIVSEMVVELTNEIIEENNTFLEEISKNDSDDILTDDDYEASEDYGDSDNDEWREYYSDNDCSNDYEDDDYGDSDDSWD
jgi:hypothetical protein